MNDSDKSKLSPQGIAKLESKMIGEVAKKPKILWFTSKLNTVLVVGILLTLVYVNMNRVEDRTLKPVTFTEAQEICKEKQMLLPITYEDLGNKLFQPTNKNEIGYWTNEQTIATLPGQMFMKDDGKKHYIYCVKENGKESSFQIR